MQLQIWYKTFKSDFYMKESRGHSHFEQPAVKRTAKNLFVFLKPLLFACSQFLSPDCRQEWQWILPAPGQWLPKVVSWCTNCAQSQTSKQAALFWSSILQSCNIGFSEKNSAKPSQEKDAKCDLLMLCWGWKDAHELSSPFWINIRCQQSSSSTQQSSSSSSRAVESRTNTPGGPRPVPPYTSSMIINIVEHYLMLYSMNITNAVLLVAIIQ